MCSTLFYSFLLVCMNYLLKFHHKRCKNRPRKGKNIAQKYIQCFTGSLAPGFISSNSASGPSMVLPHVICVLGHVTCLGQWDISKHDINRGSSYTCISGLVLRMLPLESQPPGCKEAWIRWQAMCRKMLGQERPAPRRWQPQFGSRGEAAAGLSSATNHWAGEPQEALRQSTEPGEIL